MTVLISKVKVMNMKILLIEVYLSIEIAQLGKRTYMITCNSRNIGIKYGSRKHSGKAEVNGHIKVTLCKLHIYTIQSLSLPNTNFLHLAVSEI